MKKIVPVVLIAALAAAFIVSLGPSQGSVALNETLLQNVIGGSPEFCAIGGMWGVGTSLTGLLGASIALGIMGGLFAGIAVGFILMCAFS